MGLAKRIAEALRRPRARGASNERHVQQLARAVQDAEPLTLVVECYDDNTIGLGVRLDTTLCETERV